MLVSEKILEINMNNVNFSHGVMNGGVCLNLLGRTLLSGDNGAGKTSFIEFLKKNQKKLLMISNGKSIVWNVLNKS